MHKTFSPAFLHIEEVFKSKTSNPVSKQDFLERFFFRNKKISKKDIKNILILKRDIYNEINSYFRNINDIIKSDMSKKSKERILEILLYDIEDSIDLFPELFSSFEENMDMSMEVYKEIYSYLNSVVQTKYKRALEKLRG